MSEVTKPGRRDHNTTAKTSTKNRGTTRIRPGDDAGGDNDRRGEQERVVGLRAMGAAASDKIERADRSEEREPGDHAGDVREIGVACGGHRAAV